MDNLYKIYILSDSIGETGERVAAAIAEQFDNMPYEIHKFSYVKTETMALNVIREASKEESVIVIFTTVLNNIRDVITNECEKHDILYFDLLKPLLLGFSNLLGQEPMHESGLNHKLDAKYFRRIAAIEFAVKYDDGKDPRGIGKADIVLVGVSRTSKTPLSMYLANKNIKVANVPLVPEVPVPEELYQISRKKIIGLTTDPMKLNEIRQERLKALGLSDSASYANVDRILEELDYSDKIMRSLKCPVINVSCKAVEETAGIILSIMREYKSSK